MAGAWYGEAGIELIVPGTDGSERRTAKLDRTRIDVRLEDDPIREKVIRCKLQPIVRRKSTHLASLPVTRGARHNQLKTENVAHVQKMAASSKTEQIDGGYPNFAFFVTLIVPWADTEE